MARVFVTDHTDEYDVLAREFTRLIDSGYRLWRTMSNDERTRFKKAKEAAAVAAQNVLAETARQDHPGRFPRVFGMGEWPWDLPLSNDALMMAVEQTGLRELMQPFVGEGRTEELANMQARLSDLSERLLKYDKPMHAYHRWLTTKRWYCAPPQGNPPLSFKNYEAILGNRLNNFDEVNNWAMAMKWWFDGWIGLP